MIHVGSEASLRRNAHQNASQMDSIDGSEDRTATILPKGDDPNGPSILRTILEIDLTVLLVVRPSSQRAGAYSRESRKTITNGMRLVHCTLSLGLRLGLRCDRSEKHQ
jgi:hypothetical protein